MTGPQRPAVRLARVYDMVDQSPPTGEVWVLVDRLWPRGVKKERLAGTEWGKDVAPSEELRRAFHHEQIGFEEFAERYRTELEESGAVDRLRRRVRETGAGTLVLLVGSKDPEHSNGGVLADALTRG